MAALVLGVVGSAIGSSIGGTVLGLTAAQVGGFIGATIGQQIDGALFSRKETIKQEGPRLSDINITASTEGAPIPRIWGRTRLGGQLIWATRFKETATTSTESTGGGKGFGGGGRRQVHRRNHDLQLFHLFRRGPQRRRCDAARPRVGGRQAHRSVEIHHALLYGHRDASPRSAHSADRGRGKRAGLPRALLHRLPGHAARGVRQPHPAASVRGAARATCGRRDRARQCGPGRRAHSGLGRVRARRPRSCAPKTASAAPRARTRTTISGSPISRPRSISSKRCCRTASRWCSSSAGSATISVAANAR